MKLLGNLGEVLVEGRGHVRWDGPGDFQFEMLGRPAAPDELARFIEHHHRDPYDGLRRFRLVVIDAEGRELHCGFTLPEITFHPGTEPWKFSGTTDGINLDAPALGEVGTEILLLVPQQHWLSWVLSISLPPPNDAGVSSHSMELLGSHLEFEYDRSTRSLTISVTGSDSFPQTYTEGWLSQPLHIMLGQLAYPRVIVRSNPRSTIIFISQTRHWYNASNGVALLDPAVVSDNLGLFFQIYAELLTFIVMGRDAKGQPHFETHPVTRFYEEIAQSMRGSRWVITLTLASAIEGLLELLFPAVAMDDAARQSDKEKADFKKHINRWPGHVTSTADSIKSLKRAAKQAVGNAGKQTAVLRLRQLRDEGKVRGDEFDAWISVRNKVMHGNIVSPFSSADNDQILMGLMSLFRRLSSLITLGRAPPAARAAPEPCD